MQEPRPMQRDRHQQLGLDNKLAAEPHHPTAECARNIGPIRMLEPQHQVTTALVVTKHRSGPIPCMLASCAIGADRRIADRVRKRQAAHGAPRWREKGNAAPAAAAERVRLLNNLAASEASWRQHDIDQPAAGTAQLSYGSPGEGCRCQHRYTSSVCMSAVKLIAEKP